MADLFGLVAELLQLLFAPITVFDVMSYSDPLVFERTNDVQRRGVEGSCLHSVLRLATTLYKAPVAVALIFNGQTWRIYETRGLENFSSESEDDFLPLFFEQVKQGCNEFSGPAKQHFFQVNDEAWEKKWGLKFGVGVPLSNEKGGVSGALWVFDFEPRSPEAVLALQHALNDLARLGSEILAYSRSERLYQTLVEKGADIISIFDAAGEVTYQSPSLQKILGYSPEEWLGQSIFHMVHPEDQAHTAAVFERIQREGLQGEMVRFRFPHKKGDWRVLECVGFNCLSDPEIQGVLATTRDVTERVQFEQLLREREAQLRESETQFEVAFKRSPLGIAIVSLEGRFVRVNNAIREIFGYEEAELLQKDFQSLTHPEDLPADLELVGRMLSGEFSEFQLEKRYRHARGHHFWAQLNVSLVRDENGTPLHFISEVQDISLRREQEERLRLLESVVVNAPDGILITEEIPLDEQGARVVYANRAFTQITGYEMEEMNALSPQLIQGPQTSREECARIRAHLEAKRSVSSQIIHYRKDGSPFWMEISVVPVTNLRGDSAHWVCFARDITTRKQTEAALQSARAQAESASQAKSDFLRHMSHEVRTPLNAILGFAQILEASNLSPTDRQNIGYILAAGQHLLELFNEVLDLARIENGKFQMHIEPVGVAELSRELLNWVRPLARQSGLSITETPIENCQCQVLADPKRLRQILLNLLSNALKYNRPGGTISFRCCDVWHGDSSFLRIEVSDSGIGIPQEKRTRLFQTFERLDAEERGIEGTGLGLALSQHFASAMGGVLDFESTPGEGSTFWIELPQHCALPTPQKDNSDCSF